VAQGESQIITSAEVIPGNENEGSEANLESMLQKEDENKLKTEGVVCDALYDSLSNRLSIEKRKKKHYIPQEERKG